MSTQLQYEALTYTVGLRLNELAAQQQRGATLAAADGVLLGFVASTTGAATGTSRNLVLAALVMLSLALVATVLTMWPRTIPGLGSRNPALAGEDATVINAMCSELSAVLAGDTLRNLRRSRGIAIATQLVATAIALVLLVASAFAIKPPHP